MPSKTLVSFLAMILAAVAAHAVPVYYTFVGNVTSSNTAGYSAGQQGTFVFRVDTDLGGYYLDHSSATPAPLPTGQFLVDYIGGSAQTADLPASGRYEYHFGYENEYAKGLFASNGDNLGHDMIHVRHYSAGVASWSAGMSGFDGYNHVFGNAGTRQVDYQLTLQAVSAINPLAPAVPEPGSLALLGLGLMGLAGVGLGRRKTQSSKA